MTPEPMSEEEIWELVVSAYAQMNPEQRRLWETIKMDPQKWNQSPYGDECGGFWVVAIIGETVIWYNEIEEGFNRSTYREYGTIKEYWCNQDDLEWALQNVLNQIQEGHDLEAKMGPPEPLL